MRKWFSWHAQNLNEKVGRNGSMLRNGRAWFRWGDKYRFHTEWIFLKFNFALSLQFEDDEEDILLHFALPLFSIYLGFGSPLLQKISRRFHDKEISLSIHDWAIWLKIFGDKWNWSKRDPWWQRGINFNIIDFIFGRTKYEKRTIKNYDNLVVPMPEGSYPIKSLEIHEDTWKRSRWPFPWHRCIRVSIDMDKGIPFPGKGENSWDCGEDASHGLTCLCESGTPEEAIGKMVESVLNNRRRYGGSIMWQPSNDQPPPSPTPGEELAARPS